MREQLQETLSALMDNEASEFEVQQILKESHNNNLRNAWSRFHLARAALHDEADVLVDDSLSARISEHLVKEAPHSISNNNWRRKPWIKPFASMMIAASVAAMVFFGAQNLPQLSADKAGPPALAEAIQPVASPIVNTGQLARNNSYQVDYGRGAGSANTDSRTNYLAAQSRLETQFNRHVMLHAEHAALNSSQGMMPFARVTRFETE